MAEVTFLLKEVRDLTSCALQSSVWAAVLTPLMMLWNA